MKHQGSFPFVNNGCWSFQFLHVTQLQISWRVSSPLPYVGNREITRTATTRKRMVLCNHQQLWWWPCRRSSLCCSSGAGWCRPCKTCENMAWRWQRSNVHNRWGTDPPHWWAGQWLQPVWTHGRDGRANLQPSSALQGWYNLGLQRKIQRYIQSLT